MTEQKKKSTTNFEGIPTELEGEVVEIRGKKYVVKDGALHPVEGSEETTPTYKLYFDANVDDNYTPPADDSYLVETKEGQTAIDIYPILRNVFGEAEAKNAIDSYTGCKMTIPGQVYKTSSSYGFNSIERLARDFDRIFTASIPNSRQLAAYHDMTQRLLDDVLIDFNNRIW